MSNKLTNVFIKVSLIIILIFIAVLIVPAFSKSLDNDSRVISDHKLMLKYSIE